MPVLKKSDIEAMLLSAQKKLFDAETALEAQFEELVTLRRQTSEQQTGLSTFRDAYYDGLVDVSLAQHQAHMAKKGETTAITEMRHLTQLLAQAEQAAAAADTASADQSALMAAREEADALSDVKDTEALRKRVAEQDQRLDIAIRELADLTALLDMSETEKMASAEAYHTNIAALEAQLDIAQATATQAEQQAEQLTGHVAEQDQQLEGAGREMADVIALLEDTEAREHEARAACGASLKVGRAAVTALITPPDIERLDQDRLNRAAMALVASGTFDPDWYLANYEDVAASGADPTLHFLEFGFAEGRAPKAAQ